MGSNLLLLTSAMVIVFVGTTSGQYVASLTPNRQENAEHHSVQDDSAERIAEIEKVLQQHEKDGLCGVILIRSGNRTLLHQAYGYADRKARIRMTTEHGFCIGSIVKPMNAAAILKLESQGKLSTEDKLVKYFPEAPADKKDITIFQLLTHTSGLKDIFGGDYEVVSRDWLVEKVLQSELLHAPGSKKQYSNSGYAMLAAVIEKCSGTSFEKYVAEYIHQPAGVSRIGYVLPGWKNSELAVCYLASGKRWGTPLDKNWAVDGPGWNLRGNGGMLATAAELCNWYEALSDGKVLDEQALKKFYGFAAGRSKATGSLALGHAGGNGVSNSLQISFVDADVHMTFLTAVANQSAEQIWPEFRQHLYALVNQRMKSK